MATALPIIRGPSTALYPFTFEYQFFTTVSNMENGNTKRSPFAPPLIRAKLPYEPLLVSDRNTLLSFFNSAKGQGGTTPQNFSVTTDQVYNNFSFDSDVFESIEKKQTLYGVEWSLSQIAASNIQQVSSLFASITSGQTTGVQLATLLGIPPTPFDALVESEQITFSSGTGGLFTVVRGVNGTTAASHAGGTSVRLAPGNTFPKISSGCFGGYPFSMKPRFQSIVSTVKSGVKVSYSEFGGGLTGFPTGSLGQWSFDNTMVTDADAAVLQAHFISNWGNLFPFPFPDEDGTVYQHVYYTRPILTVTHKFLNDVSIKIDLIQMNS